MVGGYGVMIMMMMGREVVKYFIDMCVQLCRSNKSVEVEESKETASQHMYLATRI